MQNGHLVIVGGGFAGLLTAKMALPYFEKVILVDADKNLGSGQFRKGCAQAAHLHVLMKKGQELLFNYFGEIEGQLRHAGCQELDWGSETEWKSRLGTFPQFETGVRTLMFSRPFLESLMLRELKANSRFELKTMKIAKVCFKNREITQLKSKDGQIVSGDFFVLSPGAGFPIAKLLMPGQTGINSKELKINVNYESVFLNHPPQEFGEFKQSYYQVTPGVVETGAVISPIENGKYVATCIDMGRVKPMRRGFVEKLQEVPSARINGISKTDTQFSKPHRFQKVKMFRRKIHRNQVAQNSVLIGDVLCSLNPVFGQGMTVAALQVTSLEGFFKKEFDHSKLVRKVQAQTRIPFFLAQLGSKVGGVAQPMMSLVLHAVKRSRRFHQFFIRQIHFQNEVAK